MLWHFVPLKSSPLIAFVEVANARACRQQHCASGTSFSTYREVCIAPAHVRTRAVCLKITEYKVNVSQN